MAGLKEIRRRIGSVSNTRQITRAMKLVSAAKLRRAQEAAFGGRDFACRLSTILSAVAKELPDDYVHPLTAKRNELKKQWIVVIAGERGLCGAFNTNVVKAVNRIIEESGIETEVVALGRRALAAGHRNKWRIAEKFESLPENAADWPIGKIAQTVIDGFEDGKCDQVILCYTEFISAINQEVKEDILLPFNYEDVSEACQRTDSASKSSEDAQGPAEYDPDAQQIFTGLMPVLIRNRLQQAGLESKAGEHAARMTAMDSATNNAGELIDKLRLHYNRARQMTITRELIDIVGGAEAVK